MSLEREMVRAAVGSSTNILPYIGVELAVHSGGWGASADENLADRRTYHGSITLDVERSSALFQDTPGADLLHQVLPEYGPWTIGRLTVHEYLLNHPGILDDADAYSEELLFTLSPLLQDYDEQARTWRFSPAALQHSPGLAPENQDTPYRRILVIDEVVLEPLMRGFGIGPFAVAHALRTLLRGGPAVLAAEIAPTAWRSDVAFLDRDELAEAQRKLWAAAHTLELHPLPGGRHTIDISDDPEIEQAIDNLIRSGSAEATPA